MEPIDVEILLQGNFTESIQEAQQKVKGLDDQVNTTSRDIESRLNSAFDGSSVSSKKLSLELERLKKELIEVTKTQENTAAALSQGKISAEEYIQTQSALSAKRRDISLQINTLSNALKEQQSITNNSTKTAGQLASAFTRLPAPLAKAVPLLRSFGQVLRSISTIRFGVIGLLVAAITRLIKEQIELNRAGRASIVFNRELQAELRKTSTELDKHFAAIYNAKKGTDAYKSAIDEVNKTYKQYLPNLLKESDGLDKIAKAQESVTKAIAKSIALRAKEKTLTEARESTAKYEDKLGGYLNIKGRQWTSAGGTPEQFGEFNALFDQWIDEAVWAGRELTVDQIRSEYYKLRQAVYPEMQIGSNDDYSFEHRVKDAIQARQQEAQSIDAVERSYQSYLATLGLVGDAEESQTVFNKQYWENKRREAEEGLNFVSETDIESIKKYRAEIAEAQKHIDAIVGKQQGGSAGPGEKNAPAPFGSIEYYEQVIQKAQEAYNLLPTFNKSLSDKLNKLGDEMLFAFGSGNVDLLTRPLLDAAELVKKGWTEAGEGIATVFSSQFGILDQNGEVIEILITPILPNGEVLSPDELEDYIYNTLEGKDILNADHKNIVLSVGVDETGEAGEKLHLLQDQYYSLRQDLEKSNNDLLIQRTELIKTIDDAQEKINAAAIRSIADEIAYKKEQYELYYKWVEYFGKESADRQFADLLKSGNSLTEYMINQRDNLLEKQEQNGGLMNNDRWLLVGLNTAIDELTGVKSAMDNFKEAIARAKEESATLLDLLDRIGKEEINLKDNASLTPEERVSAGQLLKDERENTLKEIQKASQDIINNYQSLQTRRVNLTKQANNDILLLESQLKTAQQNNNKEQVNTIQAAIIERQKSLKQEQTYIDSILFEESQAYKQLFEDIQRFGAMAVVTRTGQISKVLQAAKQAYGEESDEFKQLEAELKAIEAQGLYEILDTVGQLGIAFSNVGGAVGNFGQALGAAADQAGNLTTAFKSENFYDRASAGISALGSVINMVTSAAAERKRAEEEYYLSVIAFQNDYNTALIEGIRLRTESTENVFVRNYEGRIKDSIEAYHKANEAYYKSIQALSEGQVKIGQKNAVSWSNVGGGAAAGAGFGAAVGSIVPVIGTALGAAIGAIGGALAGLFGGRKKKDVFGDLLTEYPMLITQAANGEERINKELAEQLIQKNLVNEKTKLLLQNTLDLEQSLEDSRKQLEGIISDLAGSLGDELRNALVEAFRAPVDEIYKVGEVFNKVIEDVLSQLIFSNIFSAEFDKLQKEMLASSDVLNGGDNDWLDDFGRFFDKIPQLTEDFNAAMEKAREEAEKYGFNLWEADENQNTLKGNWQNLSEQTGGVLAGQFGAVRIDLAAVRVNVASQTNTLAKQLNHLSAIEANTRYLQTINEFVEEIRDIVNSDGGRDFGE